MAIQDMWKRNLGVSVLLRSEEWKVMLNRYREGQFQVIRLGWTADYDHPQTFLEQFLSENPQNKSGWGDPRFDEAMRQAAATAETEASIRLYRKAEGIALEAMPRLPLFFETRSTLVKPWVKGFWELAQSAPRQYLWIDPGWQRGCRTSRLTCRRSCLCRGGLARTRETATEARTKLTERDCRSGRARWTSELHG